MTYYCPSLSSLNSKIRTPHINKGLMRNWTALVQWALSRPYPTQRNRVDQAHAAKDIKRRTCQALVISQSKEAQMVMHWHVFGNPL
jgi:hypothetical protein